LSLARYEFCVVGDVVDFNNFEQKEYGGIRDIKPQGELYPDVLIFSEEKGVSYLVKGNNIICLHNEQEKETPEEGQPSVSLNFIADLLPFDPFAELPYRKEKLYQLNTKEFNRRNGWSYIKYVFWNLKLLSLFREILSNADFQDSKNQYIFTKNTIEQNPDILELDKKLLQYIVLLMKNNPNYFSIDGYKYFLYDNLNSFVNAAIVSPSASILQPNCMAAISETEFIVTSQFFHEQEADVEKTLAFIYTIDNEAKEIKLKDNDIESLNTIISLAYAISNKDKIVFGEPQELTRKMGRFVELITIWDVNQKY
jgi:hypothetical protein